MLAGFFVLKRMNSVVKKTGRLVVSLALLIGLFSIAVRTSAIFDFALLEWKLGWMTSFLFPRVLFLIVTLALSVSVVTFCDGAVWLRTLIFVTIFGFCIVGFVLLNPPYNSDWSKKGIVLQDEPAAQAIEAFLDSAYTDFEGVVCLALHDCPYCINAIPLLELLSERNTDLRVVVMVYAVNSQSMANFKLHVKETDMDIYRAPKPEETFALAMGTFPAYVYVKNGRAQYLWTNAQFGFPALDWIEAGLN
ncbi:MAG: hypothetical protein RL266_2764 [Bacteroidota bacterium]|jgi:thiol-disulfide isomerase/thioredoxin